MRHPTNNHPPTHTRLFRACYVWRRRRRRTQSGKQKIEHTDLMLLCLGAWKRAKRWWRGWKEAVVCGCGTGSHSRREQLFVCVLSFCTFRYLALSGECHLGLCCMEYAEFLFLTSKVTCERNRYLSLEWKIRHQMFFFANKLTDVFWQLDLMILWSINMLNDIVLNKINPCWSLESLTQIKKKLWQ